MGRSADVAGDPVIGVSGVTVPRPWRRRQAAIADDAPVRSGTVRPFVIGTAVGGLAGAVAGTLLSQRTRRLLVGLIHLAGRRLSDEEREELRFELLLQ